MPFLTFNHPFALISGALGSAMAILLGAFAAHGLTELVTPERLATWHTAARYLQTQSLGLLAIAALSQLRGHPFTGSARLIFAGVSVFSGSLFTLVLTDLRWLGALAPIGGVLMISGWLHLAWHCRPKQTGTSTHD